MATTTIDLDTELSAVNNILGAIGQAPLTELNFENPEVSFIFNLLRDANVDTQAEGWHFNTERHVKYTPDSVTGKIAIANDVLQMDVSEGWTRREYDVVRRSGYLYDKIDHTDDFSSIDSIDLDVVKLQNYEDLPVIFRRYITYRASRMAATQLVANPQLVQLLGSQEALSRASLMEYECNQGNHSMMGFEDETSYQTYQPWRTLRR